MCPPVIGQRTNPGEEPLQELLWLQQSGKMTCIGDQLHCLGGRHNLLEICSRQRGRGQYLVAALKNEDRDFEPSTCAQASYRAISGSNCSSEKRIPATNARISPSLHPGAYQTASLRSFIAARYPRGSNFIVHCATAVKSSGVQAVGSAPSRSIVLTPLVQVNGICRKPLQVSCKCATLKLYEEALAKGRPGRHACS